MIELKKVNKAFGEKIIKDLNLIIPDGKTLAIVGPSGGGKTTLLRILAGLESSDSGEFYLDGVPFNPFELKMKEQVVGVVFQDFQLFPHLNIFENITLAPKMVLKQTKEEYTKKAEELAASLGISDLLNIYPYQLSGGQKQRVAIARALAMNPRVLAYDEPTSALDPELRQQVERLILSLKEDGVTQIIVTHDLVFAENVGDQLLKVSQFIKKGEDRDEKNQFSIRFDRRSSSFAGCSNKKTSADNWATINEEKKIVIGLDDTFVPMGFRDKDGKLTGFDIDLAKAVFEQYGITVDFQPIDWSMKEFELNNGTIDLIWNGYSKTPAREKKVQFTKPYMENDQVLITPKESGITNFGQMNNKRLGAQNGSSGYDVFTKQPEVLKEIVKNQDAVLYDSFNEALIDLKSRRVDGLLMDKVYADYYLKQRNELEDFNITKGSYESEDFAVGARKSDSTLVKKINEALDQLEKTGEFQKISDKWFGEDVTPRN